MADTQTKQYFDGYEELSKIPPEKFLDWEAFGTPSDGLPGDGYSDAQYQKGLNTGREYGKIQISVTSVWAAEELGAEFPSGCQSYEGIGYHSCTKELLHGFIDSGAEIWVCRWIDDEPWTKNTRIQ